MGVGQGLDFQTLTQPVPIGVGPAPNLRVGWWRGCGSRGGAGHMHAQRGMGRVENSGGVRTVHRGGGRIRTVTTALGTAVGGQQPHVDSNGHVRNSGSGMANTAWAAMTALETAAVGWQMLHG
jgi:hypothetical protein